MKLDSGSVSGKDITFTVTRQGRNGDVKVEYKGTVDGDTIKGTFCGHELSRLDGQALSVTGFAWSAYPGLPQVLCP